MSSQWTVWFQAHQGSDETRRLAQKQLLERYGGAIRRYFAGALRDREDADELFQEFIVRLLGGRLGGADPARGRLRDFLKGVLFRLIADHFKQRQKQPPALPADHSEPAVDSSLVFQSDEEFLASWKEELLERAWSALAEAGQKRDQPYYQVLRFRQKNPHMPSGKMAECLSEKLHRSFTAAGVRQLLHRARDKFADLLLQEVAFSLDNPTADELQEELVELGLLEYCRPALGRREPE